MDAKRDEVLGFLGLEAWGLRLGLRTLHAGPAQATRPKPGTARSIEIVSERA